MPEQIEEILKQIHVLFSKSSMYQGSPDRIILNKREMFELLEKLNYAVMEVMEQYEATEQSRKNAQLKLEADKQGFIKHAHEEANDIYAAARMYADNALVELSEIVNETKRALKARCDLLESDIDARLDMIQNTRGELRFDLEAMANSEKYLSIIEDYNNRREEERIAAERRRAEADAEEDEQEVKVVRKIAPGVIEPIETEEEMSIPSKFDIKVNARPESIFDRSLDKGKNKKKNKKAKTERSDEDEVSLRSEDLDAEYYRWQEEQEGTGDSHKEEKKTSLFARFKEKK